MQSGGQTIRKTKGKIMNNVDQNVMMQLDVKHAKKAYDSPALKQYGAIHLVTQATGLVNGDAGPGMMA